MDSSRRLVDLSKAFLVEYFSDGLKRQPSQLEDEIVGGCNTAKLFLGDAQWLHSPFAPALGELIDEGRIRAWKDDNGWHYQAIP